MIKHIIFDLDGTLVESSPVCVAILNAMLAARGSARRIDPMAIKPYLSLGGTHLVKAMLGTDCGDPDEEIWEFRRRYLAYRTPEASLFDGVREGLNTLRRAGYRASICSNKPQYLCDKVLSELGIDHQFDLVIGGSSARRAKPAPDMLIGILDHHQLNAEHCLFVGDSEVDHRTAHALGMPFMLISHGYGTFDQTIPIPDVVDSFGAFLSHLLATGTAGQPNGGNRKGVALSAAA